MHHVSVLQVHQVTDGVMHQRIIGLPGGGQVNVPEGLIGSIEGIGCLWITRYELALEEINGGRSVRDGTGVVPIGGYVTHAGLDLIVDAKRRVGNRGRAATVHACWTPHATGAAIRGVAATTLAAIDEFIGYIENIVVGQVHIIHDSVWFYTGIDQGKPEPGFEGKLPIRRKVEVRSSDGPLEVAGQRREIISPLVISHISEKYQVSDERDLERRKRSKSDRKSV